MSYESTFNQELGKKLAKVTNPVETLDAELTKMRSRMLELNTAREKMRQGYQQVLSALADIFPQVDLKDPNIEDSANRMARALIEICSGLGANSKDLFATTFPAESYNQVVILKNINFTSLCSHHFFPFTGKAHVGYLPGSASKHIDGKVIGLSKLARIVDVYAQRPQLQERLSFNIMCAIRDSLSPAGVMVVVEGSHGCLNCRGAKKESASMVTSAVYGNFKDDVKLREEFLSLIH